MKLISTLFLIAIVLVLQSCVQPSYNRTIIFKLKVPARSNITSVGVRGNDKPFNWNSDYPLQFDPADSTYKGSATMRTGYLFTEFKFVVDGDFEFKDQANRKLFFENKDTIVYTAQYNTLQ